MRDGPPAGTERIRNVLEGDWVTMLDGIRGRRGVTGLPRHPMGLDHMGLDLIEMEPGTSFPCHTHPGAHILFVLEGEGTVTIRGDVHRTCPGDCYYIDAEEEHAVGAVGRHRLLSIGFPHKQIDDPARMRVVEEGAP
jgi:mannose-6-phosphate isomerase-like protein (cupin superfamily)